MFRSIIWKGVFGFVFVIGIFLLSTEVFAGNGRVFSSGDVVIHVYNQLPASFEGRTDMTLYRDNDHNWSQYDDFTLRRAFPESGVKRNHADYAKYGPERQKNRGQLALKLQGTDEICQIYFNAIKQHHILGNSFRYEYSLNDARLSQNRLVMCHWAWADDNSPQVNVYVYAKDRSR